MIILAVDLTLIAFIALPLCAIALGVTVYFFLKTRESLQETVRTGRKNSFIGMQMQKAPEPRRSLIAGLEEKLARRKSRVPEQVEETPARAAYREPEENLGESLKTTLAQQQKVLNTYLQKIEQLEVEGREDLLRQNAELEKEIARLHGVIEEKDAEIEDMYQQANGARKMAAKIEEVYREFEQLQTKMSALERQAGKANNLAIELEDAKHAYEQIHQELARKHERLDEIMQENQRLRQEMNTLEDKLSDSNLQRQQLQKKIVFLQDLNTEMQDLSEANKKLQTELRRIGELESMLNMMAEERDSLLRKRSEK